MVRNFINNILRFFSYAPDETREQIPERTKGNAGKPNKPASALRTRTLTSVRTQRRIFAADKKCRAAKGKAKRNK